MRAMRKRTKEITHTIIVGALPELRMTFPLLDLNAEILLGVPARHDCKNVAICGLTVKMNFPLLDVPLSRLFMLPSIAVPRASFS